MAGFWDYQTEQTGLNVKRPRAWQQLTIAGPWCRESGLLLILDQAPSAPWTLLSPTWRLNDEAICKRHGDVCRPTPFIVSPAHRKAASRYQPGFWAASMTATNLVGCEEEGSRLPAYAGRRDVIRGIYYSIFGKTALKLGLWTLDDLRGSIMTDKRTGPEEEDEKNFLEKIAPGQGASPDLTTLKKSWAIVAAPTSSSGPWHPFADRRQRDFRFPASYVPVLF